MKLRRKLGVAIALAAIVAPVSSSMVRAGTAIDGTGATFPANLIDICAAQYNRSTLNNAAGDTVAYVSPTGSSGGKSAFTAGTKVWAATDSAYSSGAPTFDYVYVPIISGAISVMYHLDGISPASATVRLSPTTVGKIFSGQIKMWNDGNIAADNKAKTIPAVKKATKNGFAMSVAKSGNSLTFTGTASAAALKKFSGKKVVIVRTSKTGVKTQIFSKVIAGKLSFTLGYQKGATYAIKAGTTSIGSVGVDSSVEGVTITFPATPIKVAYRSGGSGTTNNFTRFLNSTVGSIWTNAANDTFTTAFPGGSGAVPADGTFQSATGSDGVANYVVSNNGSITYTEMSYVEERKTASIKSALIGNNAGKFVAPSAAATGAFYAEAAVAANGLVTPDYTVAAADAYLINAVSYGLGATANNTANTAVKSWFTYFLNKCAPASAAGAFYAPLAGNILAKALAQAAKVSSI